MLSTTFQLLRKADACREGYRKLAKALGGVSQYGARTPITLLQVLDSNGMNDAMWCLRAVLPEQTEERDRFARQLACDYAEHVVHLGVALPGVAWTPSDTIAVARRYAVGAATEEELAAARAAAGDAIGAAIATASAATWDATWDAAWDAACAAARNAAYAAAWDAVCAAASAAVRDAEREWQEKRLREALTGVK